jgi:hypothetical protein
MIHRFWTFATSKSGSYQWRRGQRLVKSRGRDSNVLGPWRAFLAELEEQPRIRRVYGLQTGSAAVLLFTLANRASPSASNHPGPTLETRPISIRLTQVARLARVYFPADFFTERGSSINRMRGESPILIRSASRWRTVI